MNASDDSRGSVRVPYEGEVRVDYPDVGDFVAECCANISTGGMFVRSDQPLQPGTRFSFQLVVGGEAQLVTGRAEVVWSRQAAESADRPAGMGVRFLELDTVGRGIIFRTVDRFIRESGGEPFDLERR